MVLAQLTKVVFKLVKTGEFDFAKFLLQVGCQVLMLQQLQRLLQELGSGRCGKLDVCGCYYFAIIVMYDASGVRLAVSKQAKILNDFFTVEKQNIRS